MYLVAGYILCVVDSVTISVTGATLWGGGGGANMLKITSKIYLKNQRLANFNIFLPCSNFLFPSNDYWDVV